MQQKTPIDNFHRILADFDRTRPAVCIDYETFYSDEYSVADSSYYAYTHHPEFDAYLVAIHSDDPRLPEPIHFVGDPKDFDWFRIANFNWVSHNVPFDRSCHERLEELRVIPTVPRGFWADTADLAAYLGTQRRLTAASLHLLGEKLEKGVRKSMKGEKFRELPEETRKEWIEYSGKDAVQSYQLYSQYADQWPDQELLLSLHTQETYFRGVRVNIDNLEKSIVLLRKAVTWAESTIPWAGEQDVTAKGNLRFRRTGEPILKSPTSSTELGKYAREQRIPLPSTTEAKSEEFQEWERQYGVKFPVIKAMQVWRRTNRLLRVCESIRERLRPDGRMETQLCYFGAQSTGRWSGRPGGGASREDEDDERGVNMQNLIKQKVYFKNDGTMVESEGEADFTVDLRALFIGDFCIADSSQIEPRVLAWLSGDSSSIRKMAGGASPYEVHAIETMGFVKEEDGIPMKGADPKGYALAKARVLALGYGAGFLKFIGMASMYIDHDTFLEIFQKPVSSEDRSGFERYLKKYHRQHAASYEGLPDEQKRIWINSWIQVMDFRDKNPKITGLWDKLDRAFKTAGKRKQDLYTITIPSGRKLMYFEPRAYDGTCARIMGGTRTKAYGGMLVENCTQATARDVFGSFIIELERMGHTILWHVHDELIDDLGTHAEGAPSDDSGREELMQEVLKVMSTPPPWMPDLPVEAEAALSGHYMK